MGEAGEQGRQVEQAVLHQRHRQRQQQLGAADARLGGGERRVLGVRLVGLVVAGDGLYHAVLHRFAQGFAVGPGAQRRLHVVEAGEAHQRFVGEDQLVQRHVAGHRQATGLGLGDEFDAAGAGQLAEVRAHAALFHQQQVAGQGHGLGGFRDPREAEEAGGRAFVGEAAFGEIGVLRGEDHRQVEGRRVLQGTPQDAVAGEAMQAVGEGHATGVAQGHQFRQLLAAEAAGQRADGVDLGVAGLAGAVEDQLGHRRGVQHRPGVGRAAQAGGAAGRGGAGLAFDVALASVARLAQGDAEVDQSRRGHQAGAVEGLLGAEAGRRGADGDDLASLDVEVADLVQATGRVDDAGASDTDGHSASSCSSWRWVFWPLMAMDSTAMRMAMP